MTVERLELWMERMDSKVDGLRTDMAEIKAMRAQIEEHHERIYGNGQPGLIKDVDRLKQSARGQQQWHGRMRWLIAAVLIPSIAAAADLIAHLVSK